MATHESSRPASAEDLSPLAREHHEVAASLDGWFSPAEFKRQYLQLFPNRSPGSILPSDYCVNRENKGNRKHPRFLKWDGDQQYRFVGLDMGSSRQLRGRAFLLTWNPKRWRWERYEESITETKRGEPVVMPWSVGNRRAVPVGSRVFLLRQGVEPRGIVASGISISDVFQEDHWDPAQARAGVKANNVQVQWQWLANPERGEILGQEALQEDAILRVCNWTPYASGNEIAVEVADRLEELFGRTAQRPWRDPTEGSLVGVEGGRTRVQVNRYERDEKLRQACLEHFGVTCQVCGLDFQSRYGAIGAGFIHVHHLTPISAGEGERRQVDPTTDLVPVCPNCHAMLHKQTPPLSIAELRSMMPRTEKVC